MRAPVLAIVACLATGCPRRATPPPDAGPGPRKPRVEITVWLDPAADAGALGPTELALFTSDLPAEPRLVPLGGVTVGVVGLPAGLSRADAIARMQKQIPDAHRAGADATIVLGEHCLPALAPAVLDNRGHWWSLAVVTGRGCGEKVASPIGVTALVELGQVSHVVLTLDRNTGALLKVVPGG